MQTEITLLLDKIKSEDMISVWPYLFQVTDTWMSAGYFNEANRLLSVFFEAKNEVAPQFYIDTYEIPWALTGTRPHNVPALTRSIDDIELGLWDNLFGPNGYWGWRMLSDCGEALSVFIDRIKTTELEKLAGNDLRVRHFPPIWIYPAMFPSTTQSALRRFLPAGSVMLIERRLTWSPSAKMALDFSCATGWLQKLPSPAYWGPIGRSHLNNAMKTPSSSRRRCASGSNPDASLRMEG